MYEIAVKLHSLKIIAPPSKILFVCAEIWLLLLRVSHPLFMMGYLPSSTPTIVTHFPVGHAPKIIKLYMNRLSLGFDEAESVEETQLIELEEKDLAENAVVPLRFVKWQNVTSVVVG